MSNQRNSYKKNKSQLLFASYNAESAKVLYSKKNEGCLKF